MEIVKKEEIASVILLEVTVSEDELMVYQAALRHILNTLEPGEVEHILGGTKEEVEGMHDDLAEILSMNSTLRSGRDMKKSSAW